MCLSQAQVPIYLALSLVHRAVLDTQRVEIRSTSFNSSNDLHSFHSSSIHNRMYKN
uniref:Uncharacterized protein n=1 Tax=Lepeophtheirus salmonis TaxID=72036 RepID=A0A0K2UZ10_LEPSM